MLVKPVACSVEPLDRLRRALDASGVVGTFAWNHPQGTVTYDKSAAELLTGDPRLAEMPVAGDAAFAAVHPDDRDGLKEHIARSVASGGPILAEYRVVSARNEVRWLLSRGRTHLGGTGKPVATHGILIDITETRDGESGGLARPPVSAIEALDDLEEIAELALRIRKRLDRAASPSMMMLIDLLLFQIGREIAAGMADGPHGPQ